MSALRGVWLSITAYLLLSMIKLGAGYLFGSEALLADGWNNASDIVASIAVLIGMKISLKPPDLNHPYGHSRAETVSSLFASFVMFAIGIQVLFHTATVLLSGKVSSPPLSSAWVAFFGMIVMGGVYLFNYRLAKKTNSLGLMAAAKDNLSDALVSLGAFIGIIGAHFNMHWLDPLTGFIVGLIICKTAYDIFKDSSLMLTDGFDKEKLNDIEATIQNIEGVETIVDIKARMAGNDIIVDAVVEVAPHLNIKEGHTITDKIEAQLEKDHDVRNATIHVEPGREITERGSVNE
ncbi:cation diffusion facilitator family transporter [Anaerobacillus sp. 1_MG-2023]|uniref:cation diffusion facilitator family transporter n=1 Tax=Bacillales TaxID=1385 RepID=UPI0026E35177|nr:cation diffusion facilitator family transporter [Anaerobacillus sp. 1_MG-2023]MDO6658019.1 cation diffusion facilitator family transporter [Anaerobacillus sp. 1_MG-2023]